jgi:hypothetical protein
MANIFTSAANAGLTQHQMENGNPIEHVNKGRSAIPVGTKHRTHRHSEIVAVYGADVISIQ